MQIRKAKRSKAKLRLGIVAPSGAGKTYSALLLAFGLGGKVGMIDTEHGSGDLYAHLGDYDIISLQAPFTVRKYLDALKAFESAGYSTVIIDSLSHAWAGDGGLLDKQGKIADQDSRGNSYAAWRKITPEHNALVEAMLQSPCHVIATMRAKQDYVQEKDDRGKTVVRKVGLAPVQRDGMEYEFTVVLDVDANHIAKTSKDRTSLFDGDLFKIDQGTGKKLLAWLDAGDAPAPQPAQPAENVVPIKPQAAPSPQERVDPETGEITGVDPIDLDMMRTNPDFARIERLFGKAVEIDELVQIVGDTGNKAAMGRWDAGMRDALRSIYRSHVDRIKGRAAA